MLAKQPQIQRRTRSKESSFEEAVARVMRHTPAVDARLAWTMDIEPVDDTGRMVGHPAKRKSPVCS